MYTILEYRVDCALGIVNETNRREFLRKLGQVGGSIATGGGPVGAVAKLAMGEIGDPLANISDDELIGTPERKWINLIPADRLLKIIARDDYDVDFELGSKLAKVVYYGIKYMAKDASLDMMRKHLEKVGYNTEKGLLAALTNSEVYIGASRKAEGKMAADAIKALEKVGIDVPTDMKRNAFKVNSEVRKEEIGWDIENQQWEQKMERDLEKDAEYNAAKMHQPFDWSIESKLIKALAAILE
jgi:hypothetical protein